MYFTTPCLENQVTRKLSGENVPVDLQVKASVQTKRRQKQHFIFKKGAPAKFDQISSSHPSLQI